jgi:hypothetical protein
VWVALPTRQEAIMRRLRTTNFRGRANTPKHATTAHLLRVLAVR